MKRLALVTAFAVVLLCFGRPFVAMAEMDGMRSGHGECIGTDCGWGGSAPVSCLEHCLSQGGAPSAVSVERFAGKDDVRSACAVPVVLRSKAPMSVIRAARHENFSRHRIAKKIVLRE